MSWHRREMWIGTRNPLLAGIALASMACDEPTEAERALALWATDKAAAAQAIRALPDPTQQLFAVESIITGGSFGLDDSWLCERFEDPAAAHCRQMLSRTHLYTAGPASSRAQPTNTRPFWGPCAPGKTDFQCATDAAVALVQQGRQRPHTPCERLQAPKLQAECQFRVAEAILATKQERSYSRAIEQCGRAADYVAECHGHITSRFANEVTVLPPGPQASTVQELMTRAAAEVADAWQASPDTARAQLDSYWATALRGALMRDDPPALAQLAGLPEEAHPHLRATSSWLMVWAEQGADHSLDGWLALAESPAWEEKVLSAPPWPQDERIESLDLWGHGADPRAGSREYLGWTRRLVSPDPSIDLTICILEAHARQREESTALLDEAISHGHPLVEATALRLRELLIARREERRHGGPSSIPRRG